MTVEAKMQEGDFAGAAALLATETAGPNPDPGRVLMLFSMEVRLQRWDVAQQTIQKLVRIAPDIGPAMAAFAASARAEAKAAMRLVDPALAGKRAGIGVPPAHALAYVKAAVCHASRDRAGVQAALAEAVAATPPCPGTLTWKNGQVKPFENLVDTDDLTGPTLPVYAGEQLLDIAYAELRSLTFGDPRTSFDTMWIPTEIVPHTGTPFVGRVPAFYAGTGVAAEPFARTGQMTLWNRDHGYALGIGQRDFKAGGLMVGILQLRRIEFSGPPPKVAQPEKVEKTEKKGFFKKLFGN